MIFYMRRDSKVGVSGGWVVWLFSLGMKLKGGGRRACSAKQVLTDPQAIHDRYFCCRNFLYQAKTTTCATHMTHHSLKICCKILPCNLSKAIYICISGNYRYSMKFETLLMAYNWHWVSSMDTNVKINIFGTYPVTSANVNRKNYSQKFFKHDGIYKYYYLFLF